MTSIRIMLVDDHDMTRRGIKVMLKHADDMELVAEASDGEEALRLIEETRPNVVIMDMLMPRMDGLEATRIIREQYESVHVVALSSFHDAKSVKDALEAGAVGYLLKNATPEEVTEAIRSASQGKHAFSDEAMSSLVAAATEKRPRQFNLTDRELEVLALLVEGQTNSQIALELQIASSTVKFHVSSILGKLGVNSRTEAVAVAMQNNIVPT